MVVAVKPIHGLDHIWKIRNNWLVSLNGVKSETQILIHGVPQVSLLGPLLFLVYINDLHNAIRCSQSYHFVDDTHLRNKSNSPKKVEEQLNIYLKLLYNWLLAN